MGKSLTNYAYQVEDLCYRALDGFHDSKPKFKYGPLLTCEDIMCRVFMSETSIPAQNLMQLLETGYELLVQVCWRSVSQSEDTVEPLQKIYENVVEVRWKSLYCNNTPADLVAKERQEPHV